MAKIGSNLAIAEVKVTGFAPRLALQLFRQCHTCLTWKPETFQYFSHNGKSQCPKTQWIPEGYCKACRNKKTKIEAEMKPSGKSNVGVAEKIREQAKEDSVGVKGSKLIVIFNNDSYPFDRAPFKRDKQEETEFIQHVVELRKRALEGDDAAIKEIKSLGAVIKK